MKTIALVLALLAMLAIAVWWIVLATNQVGGLAMPISGWIAMALGIVFSLIVGVGLMALVFYSSRKGYDEPPKYDTEP
jgi:hypothetical protein